MDRNELLERISSSRAELEALLGAVPGEELDRALGDGWSVKQHVAHRRIYCYRHFPSISEAVGQSLWLVRRLGSEGIRLGGSKFAHTPSK